MRKIYTIKINGKPWTEEILLNYTSKKFGLPLEMNLEGYRLNRILCHDAMANLHDRSITLEELDKFLVTEYKKQLLESKKLDPIMMTGNLNPESIDLEEEKNKLR